MEGLLVRPVWSLSGGEKLSALDALHAALNRLQTRRLELLAALHADGYATELGARSTADLIAIRHRLDPTDVRRDLRLAQALRRYPLVDTALRTTPNPGAHSTGTDPTGADSTGADSTGADFTGADSTGAESASADSLDSEPAGADSVGAGSASADPTAAECAGADSLDSEPAGADSAGAELAKADSAGDAAPSLSAAGGTEAAAARAGAAAIGVHLGQAAVIVGELEKVRALPRVSPEDRRVVEEVMVRAAGVLAPGDLRVLGRQVRERLDTDGPEPGDEERVYARERLWLKRQGGGVQFGGYLAGENAELLQTLTFAGAKPHKTPAGDPDPRTRAQRQADALSGVLAAAASTGTAAPGHGGIKPHITVTIDWALLTSNAGTGTGAAAGSAAGTGAATGTGFVTGAGAGTGSVTGVGVGVLAHGGTLSVAAIRRLACDAGIIPLVLGSNSEPLDVGMEQRFVTPAIRHALNARDRGCVVCRAPAAMCDAHHVIHWIDGGPTAIQNLVLVCKAHHREIHHGHWSVTFTNGHPVLSRPTWANTTPTPARSHSTQPTNPPHQPGTQNQPSTPPSRPGAPAPQPEATSQSGAPTPQPGATSRSATSSTKSEATSRSGAPAPQTEAGLSGASSTESGAAGWSGASATEPGVAGRPGASTTKPGTPGRPGPSATQSGATSRPSAATTQPDTPGRSATSTIRPGEQTPRDHAPDHHNTSPPEPTGGTDKSGSLRPEPKEPEDARHWAAESNTQPGDPAAWSSESSPEPGGPAARSSESASGAGADGLGPWGSKPGAGRPAAGRSEGGGLEDARAWAAESGVEAAGAAAWSSESGAGAGGLGSWGLEAGAGRSAAGRFGGGGLEDARAWAAECHAAPDGLAVRSAESGARLDEARAWAAEVCAEADGLGVWGSESGAEADGLGVWGPEPAGLVGRQVGGVVHPLADRLSRWLRQGKADYLDPWADKPPEPPGVKRRADSPPAPARAD